MMDPTQSELEMFLYLNDDAASRHMDEVVIKIVGCTLQKVLPSPTAMRHVCVHFALPS